MGKRGPRPKGEYGGKIPRTAVFSTRIQPDTRARLAKAAKDNNRSESQELEHRLRRTFVQDDQDFNLYGSQLNAAIINLLGEILQTTCTSWCLKTTDGWNTDIHKDPGEWLRDQRIFDEVVTAIFHALMWFRPAGTRDAQFIFFNSSAHQIINEIRTSDPSLSIMKRSTRQHTMAKLKDKLGDFVRRRHPYDHLWPNEPPVRV
jgi:hypothetical protein